MEMRNQRTLKFKDNPAGKRTGVCNLGNALEQIFKRSFNAVSYDFNCFEVENLVCDYRKSLLYLFSRFGISCIFKLREFSKIVHHSKCLNHSKSCFEGVG